jgi:hypothetical protein
MGPPSLRSQQRPQLILWLHHSTRGEVSSSAVMLATLLQQLDEAR